MHPGPYERHLGLLQEITRAAAVGDCRRPFTESTGQEASDAGMRTVRTAAKVFSSLLGRPFDLDQPGQSGWVVTESSPFGIVMDVGYPRCDPAAVVEAAVRATAGWRAAGLRQRAGVAVEILRRLNTRSHELALAVHHTTGLPLEAAFRAAGPRAQDRALQTVAQTFAECSRVPEETRAESSRRRRQPLTIRATSTLVPHGVSLLIGCPDQPCGTAIQGCSPVW